MNVQEELSRMNIANIPRPPVHRRPVPGASGKSQESTLWQNRSKVHSIEKQGTVQQIPLAFLDCVSSQAHQLDMTISSSSNQATIDNIGNDLIAAFLTLARDADSKVGPLDGSSTAPSEKITPASLAWKIVKDRQGVCVQKRRLVAPGFQSELTKATISIDCDSERVYSILSHPEHFRHVEETYMASSIFRQFSESASIRHSQFMLGRNILKDYLVFEVKCKVDSTGHDSSSLEPTRQTSFIVVMRSIAGYKEDSAEPLIDLKSHPEDTLATDSVPPEDHDSMNQVKTKITGDEPPELMVSSGAAISDDLAIINTDDAAKIIEARTIPAVEESTSDPTAQAVAVSQNTLLPPEPPTSVVYLYGYLIEPSSTDANSCRVTVLSQLSPDISRLEANFNTCRKLKNFVEEYVALSSRAQSTSTSSSSSLLSYAASELRKRRMFTTGVEGGEKRIDKLKNLVSSTAGYLMKNKRTPGWFGAAGASLESGVGQDDASSMDSRVENASDVDEAAFRGVDDVDSISAREDLFNFEETAVPSQSYESRGFIVSEDLQRHKTLNEQEANGLTRDSSSISTSSAPTVSSSLMSKVSDIVTGELMTSAAAIARTVTKKRSLTFLKKLPGTQGDASEDEAEPMGAVRATVDETTKSDIPVGDSLDPALYQEKRIFGREIVREDLSFTRRTDGGHAEFKQDFERRAHSDVVSTKPSR
ncbi:hypothetical protein DFJ73DRAFT_280855 [Zopfochytrium polystomum]|nr:hypothetical protein DFJ73DRAFT_280855 [Zopfochytrium polystomum]